MAHFLEHMLFKGTETRDAITLNDEIENLGGQMNAFTAFDHTAFHLTLAREVWRPGLEILLDMAFRSRIDENEVEIERRVILEEIQEGNDSLELLLGDKSFEAIYPDHPLGRPVTGTKESIQEVPAQSLISFYQRWYRPRNMVLTVAGDLDWEAVTEMAREATNDLDHRFENIPFPSLATQVEEPRVVSLAKGKEERILEVAFPIPALPDSDLAGLELLTVLLTGGETSRLYREMRLRQQLARSIHASLFVVPVKGRLFIATQPHPGKEMDLLAGIVEEIRHLQEEGISPLELSQAKLTLEKELLFTDETAEGRARALGYFEMMYGSWQEEERYRNRMLAVREDEIVALARKYLSPSKMDLFMLVPSSETVPEAAKIQQIREETKKETKIEPKAELCPQTERRTLKGGLRLILRRVPGMKVGTIYGAMKGGLLLENSQTNGISSLIAATVDRGTSLRSDEQIAQEITWLQGEIDGIAERDFHGLRIDSVGRNLPRTVELFFDLFFCPSFPTGKVKEEKAVLLSELEAQDDYFESLVHRVFLQNLYGEHPYGLEMLGTKKSLKSLESGMLAEHYSRLLQPKNMVVAIVGDFDLEEMAGAIAQRMESLPRGEPPSEKTGNSSGKPTSRLVRKPIRGEKCYVTYGFKGVAFGDPDGYALDVLASVLASSGGGRLYIRLREELGLVYSIDASVVHGIDPGYFAISFNTNPEQVDQTLNEMKSCLEGLQKEVVSEEELTRVKNYLIGSYRIHLQRSGVQAAQLCLGELFRGRYDLDDYVKNIQKVTATDIRKVATKYLVSDEAVEIWLSPALN